MFKPVNMSHAIIEVHFVLDIDRPWLAEDQPLIEEGYKKYWHEILPRRIESQQFLVNLGPQIQGLGMSVPPNPMTPIFYNSVSRDGSREWELGFNGNQVRVTCGKYSRWEHVWKIANNLFQMVGKSLSGRDTGIITVELTYQDLFVWEGEEKDYDVRRLLSCEDEVIGRSMLGLGPLWHSHQGWMKDQNKWPEEDYLERIHLDASKGMVWNEERFGIFITTTTRLGHGGTKKIFSIQKGFHPLKVVNEKSDTAADRFEWLHTKAKSVFSKVLTKETQESINLWAK